MKVNVTYIDHSGFYWNGTIAIGYSTHKDRFQS